MLSNLHFNQMLPFFLSLMDYKDLQEQRTNMVIIQDAQFYHKRCWLGEMNAFLSLLAEMNLQHGKKIWAFVCTYIYKIHLFVFPLPSGGKLPTGTETCHSINYLPVSSPG